MARLSLIATLVCTVVAIPSSAQQRIEYDDYRLDNGLRMILVEDHSVPVVTIDLWYNVGSGPRRVVKMEVAGSPLSFELVATESR